MSATNSWIAFPSSGNTWPEQFLSYVFFSLTHLHDWQISNLEFMRAHFSSISWYCCIPSLVVILGGLVGSHHDVILQGCAQRQICNVVKTWYKFVGTFPKCMSKTTGNVMLFENQRGNVKLCEASSKPQTTDSASNNYVASPHRPWALCWDDRRDGARKHRHASMDLEFSLELQKMNQREKTK
jgi:hypothetical protein